MAEITLKGNPIHTCGDLPSVGSEVRDFRLTRGDLSDCSLADFAGKKKIINIVPSLDTAVCQTSLVTFNQKAAQVGNTVILTISRDLPFAQKRFCEARGIDQVVTLSEMRNREFGRQYGVEITDGPLAGVLARAVLVVDEANKVVHAELVSEIAQEPDYEKALAAAS